MHAVESFDWFVARQPPLVTFTSYIDDSGIQISSSDREQAVQLAITAGRVFYAASKSMHASVNDKVAVVASDIELARATVRGLGLEPTVAKQYVTYLGADDSAGAKRSAARARVKQRSRLWGMKLRLKQIWRLKARALNKEAKQGLSRVLRTGVAPALSYGSEVFGFSEAALNTVRRAQSRRLPSTHGGTSATAKDVLYGEWDTRAAVGPALQWCRMLWNAQVNSTRALIPFQELLQLWE